MHNYITYDIETVANKRAKDYYAQKEYSAPVNYKDPEKIAAAVASARERDCERAGLHWWTGKVVCIGAIALEKNWEEKTSSTFTDKSMGEKHILSDLANYLNAFHFDTVLVGKSSEDFDKPFLIGRYMANNIPVPQLLKDSRPIRDVDHIFSHSRSCSQVSRLSDYAWGLEIAGKSGHGSQVQMMYDKGEFDDIEKYCLDDNRIVAEMIKRYNQ